MKRKPEAELMDNPEQARAYANADFEEAHSMFVSLFRDCFPGMAAQGTMLDLGCGAADISIRLAHAFHGYQITAVDGAINMLKFARDEIARRGLQEQVQLLHVHLPMETLSGKKFDVVFSNSLLHHLKDPATLWKSIKQHANHKTRVFVMDLIRPKSAAAAHALVEKYTDYEPDILQQDFHNSLLAAYRPEEVSKQLDEYGLNGLSIKTVSDRHFIVWGQLP